MNKFFSKYGAYVTALVIFVALACIYCAPSFEGKIVNAGDTSSYRASIHEVEQYQKESGEKTFWTGSVFSGMPTYQIGATKFKSLALLSPFRKTLLAGHNPNKTPVILILYFVCFYILLRCFNVDKWLGIAGAIAMALSSYFIVIIPAGHMTKASTIAIISLTVGGFHLIFKRKYALGFILTSLPVAIAFVNHIQMSYYIYMMIGVMFIAELYIHIKEKRIKDFIISTTIFAGSVVLGFGASSASILASREYMKETIRGGHSDIASNDGKSGSSNGLDIEYATEWSYGIDETLSLLIPGVMGGASSVPVGEDSKLYRTMVNNRIDRRMAAQYCQNAPLYWGDQRFTAGNVYVGAIVCFLFVLGLIIVKGPYKWALAIATLFSILLAWGHNLMPITKFFFNFFPLYSKFRVPSSILVVAEIAMPLLGFMAIRDIMLGKADRAKATRGIYISAGITAGICLIMIIFGRMIFSFTGAADTDLESALPGFVYDAIIAERKSLLASDSFRSLLFIVLAAGTLWIFINGKMKSAVMISILGILIIADMWPVDRRYFNSRNYVTAKQNNSQFEMLPYEKQILADPDPHFRVLNLTTSPFNDARTSYYLKSLGGYSSVKLRRYQDLIDEHISKLNMNVISMLNAKYIIIQGENNQPAPMRNTQALGNAWYVDTLLIMDNARQECDALNFVDLSTTAVIGKDFADFAEFSTKPHDESAQVRLVKYAPNHIDYESSSVQDGTIVFSEVYYPYGWKATIDGQPATHFRADYALRALNVPAGKHQIRFEFVPGSVRTGDILSTICICIIYIGIISIVAASILRHRKKTGISGIR